MTGADTDMTQRAMGQTAGRTMTRRGRLLSSGMMRGATLGLILGLALAGAAPAQQGGMFAPRMTINGQVITNYEIDQRVRFLQVLRAPGNPEAEALRGLIEDRLGAQAAEAAGVSVTPEEITAGMAEFAGRANLTTEQFLQALAEEGVAAETFRDFVQAGLLWRAAVRDRFAGTASVSDTQVERAIVETARKTEVQVLLSELVIPAPQGQGAEALAEAGDIRANLSAEGGFAAAARAKSAASTAERGGRLDWMPLSNLPPAIAQQVLTLAPGEVTEPIVVPNAVLLLQLNNLSESESPTPAGVKVGWAEYLLAPGEDPAAVRARVDRCGDLNLVARGQAAERLVLRDGTMGAIPADIGMELAKLDPGESSTALRRGAWTVFLMLCTREGLREAPAEGEAAEGAPAASDAPATEAGEAAPADDPLAQDRDAVRNRLGNQQIALKAAAWMEELRSEAIITEP